MSEKMSDGDLNELALRVKDLLIENGAVRPEEGADVEHCMTVPEICERIGLNEGEWKPVQLRMFRLGNALAVMPGRGFYNGIAGEQASCISLRIKTARALVKSAAELIEAGEEAGELENMLPWLRDDLGDDFNDIPKLAEVVGKRLEGDLETKLLAPSEPANG